MEDKKFTVRAAERALDILLCFVEKSEWSLTEIAQHTGLNKSTVYRLLVTLEGKGFLRARPDTERYRLGFRIWELSANLSQSDDPAVLFLPEMERLRMNWRRRWSAFTSGTGWSGSASRRWKAARPCGGGAHRRPDAPGGRRFQQSAGGLRLPGDAGGHSERSFLAGIRRSGAIPQAVGGDSAQGIRHQHGREGSGRFGRGGARSQPFG